MLSRENGKLFDEYEMGKDGTSSANRTAVPI
jgi:hypothetical protein